MIMAHMDTNSSSDFMDRMMNNMMGGGSGMFIVWLLWLIFSLLLISALVLGIIALIRYLSKDKSSAGRGAEDILKERYAKGEISRDQYQKMKKELESKK